MESFNGIKLHLVALNVARPAADLQTSLAIKNYDISVCSLYILKEEDLDMRWYSNKVGVFKFNPKVSLYVHCLVHVLAAV